MHTARSRLGQLTRWRPAQRVRTGIGEGLRISRDQASADYASGMNEVPVQQALADLLGPGDVFVDVGANVGWFSLLAARLVGETGHVYAIEPVAMNVKAIVANVRRNRLRNVTVLDLAASDSDGTTVLTLTRHPGGAVIASANTPPDATGETTVRTATIDSLVSDGHLLPPALLKIDVEGAEEAVVRGMTATLHDHRPTLIVEVDGPDDPTMQARRSSLIDLLAANDYDASDLVQSYPTIDWQVAHLVAQPRNPR
jgi:FkbM family methyltransferase